MDRLAEPEATAPKTDTPGIHVPPPVYYVAAFLAGVALELIFPTDWPPPGVRLAVALLAAGAWIALDGAASVFFRRARTSIMPMKPTTALVTSGPYRVIATRCILGWRSSMSRLRSRSE
jgi:protein-S-isoprenylcysteine O-methyltransferase Ste14